MKRLILVVSLSMLFNHGYSQSFDNYIGISVGAGIPVGKFAATNGDLETCGYAVTGFSFNINYLHKLNENFGLAVSVFNGVNGVNTTKLLSYANYYGNTVGSDMSVDKRSNIHSLLAGGYIKKKDFPVYAKIQMGVGAVQPAEISDYENGRKATIPQPSPTYGFTYCAGVGALFPVFTKWAFMASIDYTSCLAKPNNVVDNHYGVQTFFFPFTYGQILISAQAGIGYTFGKHKRHKAGQNASHKLPG